jgi:type IV pilus assembly protein PilP
MTAKARWLAGVAPLIWAFVGSAACSSPAAPVTLPEPDAGPAVQAPVRGPGAATAVVATTAAPLPKVDFHEDDFAENDRSRDPFRSFAKLFTDQGKGRVRAQRRVLLDHYSIEDLKLIGLITRTDTPRAMLVDPTGRGWVVTKGQFIGRPEVIHAGGPGGVDYELNWKIDRIRDNDVVLIREDPSHVDVAPTTRVIPLRTNEQGLETGIDTGNEPAAEPSQ